jgi:hypothetical protein
LFQQFFGLFFGFSVNSKKKITMQIDNTKILMSEEEIIFLISNLSSELLKSRKRIGGGGCVTMPCIRISRDKGSQHFPSQVYFFIDNGV